MKQYISFLALSCLILMLTSCKDTEVENTGFLASDYYPLEIGKIWDYRVDSTIIDDLGAVTINTTSFIREHITEILNPGTTTESFVIQRSYKSNELDEWTKTDLWTVRKENGDIFRTEENLDFLILKSQVRTGASWDGILFDDRTIVSIAGEQIEVYKSWDFKYNTVLFTDEINGVNYDNITLVQQANDENKIEKRCSQEKYQFGLGMVQKVQQIFDTQCIEECEGMPWLEKAERGYQVIQTLIAHN